MKQHDTKKFLFLFGSVALICVLASSLVSAQETDADANSAKDAAVRVFHSPPATWQVGARASVVASVEGDWKAEVLQLRYRAIGAEGGFASIDFKRKEGQEFVALIPRALIQPPGIAYFIESRGRDGERVAHFASPKDPHPVYVVGETDELREAQRLARHNGHRSSFEIMGEFTVYGERQVTDDFDVDRYVSDPDSDLFWVTEAQYTYRRLQTLYDIYFGIGFMRGQHATVTIGDETLPIDLPQGADSPGLNYGYGGATLELHRHFSFSGKLILGASEEGFAAGVGGLLRIGQIAGTRFEIGGEAVQDAGSRGFMRFAWDTVPRLPMALTIEANGWPDISVNPVGTRLYYDVGLELTDAITVGARVGRVTRSEAVEAGLMGGLTTSYAF